ncbi:SgcJ/EcaC family oxidoreductase [Streptomyces nojiriensis]
MTADQITATATAIDDRPGPPVPRSRRPTVKRVLVATALALGLIAGGGYLWLSSTSDVKATGTAKCTAVTATGAGDRDAVCALLSSLAQAWGNGDADAYGAAFTQDATYTTYVGTYYQGRSDIIEAHRALFSGFVKGTKLADSLLGIRFLGPDTALVTSRGDTYTGGKPGELTKVQTYTMVREGDGQWRIAAFQNTQRRPVMEKVSFLLSPGTIPAAEK